ncbi:MAG: hypothetical protein ABEI76_09395 [Halobacteriales archaeon]
MATVLEDERTNATLAWLLVVFLGVVVIENVVSGDLLWAGFAGTVLLLALIPTVTHRRPAVMLPWEVLLLATLPLLGRSFATVALTSRFATYLSVAAIALIIAVELHVFTRVLMTPSFAVFFVVITTMAAAGTWAVVRWSLDILFGTQFLLIPGVEEATIEKRLMWEFVYSTVAGIAGGVIFEGYFRRRSRIKRRLPEDIEVSEP